MKYRWLIIFLVYTQAGSNLGDNNDTLQKTIEEEKQVTPATEKPQRNTYGYVLPQYYEYTLLLFYTYYYDPYDNTVSEELTCSGALIAPKWIVTVAHCFEKPLADVKTAFPNATTHQTTSWPVGFQHGRAVLGFGLFNNTDAYRNKIGLTIYMHKLYFPNDYVKTPDGHYYMDIGLVELEQGVARERMPEPGLTVGFDRFQERYNIYSTTLPPRQCWTIGAAMPTWDRTWDRTVDLYYTHPVEVGTRVYCRYMQKRYDGREFVYAQSQLCGQETRDGGNRACMGAGGSPLVCDGKLTGLFSERRETAEKCGGREEHAFSVFVAVGSTEVYGWVSSVMGNDAPYLEMGLKSAAAAEGVSTGKVVAVAAMVLWILGR